MTEEAGRKLRIGTAGFVVAEIATLGTVLAAFAYVRVVGWSLPDLVDVPSLVTTIPLASSGLLVASAITCFWAHAAIHEGDRDTLATAAGLTMGLGLLFLVGQMLEYRELLAAGFVPSDGAFGAFFYGATALHAVHVAIGVALWGVVRSRARLGHYDADRHTSVTCVAYYWQAMVALWLVTLAVVYSAT